MVNPLAPIAEKLSVNFCFMSSIAVLIPTRAMIPKAMMATVMPVRTLLLFTVRKARASVSWIFMVQSVAGEWSRATDVSYENSGTTVAPEETYSGNRRIAGLQAYQV